MGIKTLSFQISPSADLELVWQLLEDAGCALLYSDANDVSQQIFGSLPPKITKKSLQKQMPSILSITEFELPEIDWEAQWAAHQNYSEGHLHLDLAEYAPAETFGKWPSLLKLIPGPGFGDHSHPTTRLVLKLMPGYVQSKNVLDVGCGSGILSLAALSLGAVSVVGIDIDEAALDHSQSNSECNGMKNELNFILPGEIEYTPENSVILINMIQSEQKVAWESLGLIKHKVSILVTSGILAEGRIDYLEQSKLWGWNLLQETEEDGWLGFIFDYSDK